MARSYSWQIMRRTLGAWRRDHGGGIALIFAFTIFIIVLIAGLAIDGARGYYASNKVTSVLDSAALAAAKAMSEREITDEEVRDIVGRYVNAHMSPESGRGITTVTPVVAIDRENDTVTVDLTTHVTTYIAVLAGYPRWEVNRRVSATFGLKNIELGMMLDVSGSMEDFDKIGTLRTAASTLVDRLIPAVPDARKTVRIGLAPYSTSLNVGEYSGDVTTDGETCVTERSGPHAFTDHAPVGAHRFPTASTWCPASRVLAMTADKATLHTRIGALAADGYTAGHLGIAWAWYLVSPLWDRVWPAESAPRPYSDRRTQKAVILMTDGMFNRRYESDNGTSAEQAARLCTNIKAQGILVYTIGYEAPAEVLPLLRNCASSAGQFYDAGNAAELMNAFERIAAHLTDLRLSR